MKKGVIFSLSIVFILSFIFAAPNAPTGLFFSNNVSASYDEGSFNVNWVSGAGDAEANYSIYVFADNVLYLKANNDSTTGYSFSNTTQANYTFIIEAVNTTGSATNSTTNISLYVDSSAPTISLPLYTNATSKKNTDSLTINISVSDALSGLTGSICLIEVNGTNQSVAISNGWCNSSSIALTNLADGNRTINVYVNDTVNNFGLNNSYVVQIDTTAPVITSPASASLEFTTESLNVDFDATDDSALDTWSVNDTNNFTINSTGGLINNTILAIGSYSLLISINDTVGNTNTSVYSVTVSDTTAPVITLIAPANSTSSTTTAYNFTFNVTDDQSIANCSLIFDGSIINTITSVNNTGGTNGMYNSSLSVATHTWSINCTDATGNIENSSTRTLIVSSATTTTTTTATDVGGIRTHSPTMQDLQEGYQTYFYKNWKMKFSIKNEEHLFLVGDVTDTTAKIIISSEPQEATFNIGETKKFDVSGDNYYDLQVTLDSIQSHKARFTLKTIYEAISLPLDETQTDDEQPIIQFDSPKKPSKTSFWEVLIAILVILGIIAFFYFKIYKKKK